MSAAAKFDWFTDPGAEESLVTIGVKPVLLGVVTGLYTLAMKSSYVVESLCFVTTVSKERARSS